jgi:hypothetical protein
MSTTPSQSSHDLPKQYDHAAAQSRWYEFWQQRGYFHSEPDARREPFTIVIPPPNVTGALHLGHALNNTLQDILVRQKRMQGFETLWLPGADHAGIATQAVVERRLFTEENKTRHDLGREGLVERIWQWKKEYETRILGQLQQMGCSCDWQRTRFTLDTVCARAVRHTFFSLFRQRLIYRGKRLVNWDTTLQTAVSDDEVFHEPVPGHFWYFHYPVIDPKPGEPANITIATTRPETMLGDTAVAVHPDPAAALDKVERELQTRLAAAPEKLKDDIREQLDDLGRRRRELLAELITLGDMARDGRCVMLPLLERPILLVADEWAKPELGTGCVKITPAHDPNDYDVGLRQNLPMVNILDLDGKLNENAGPYAGQTVLEGRQSVVADLERRGLVVKVEDRQIDLAHSDRSKTPIEPLLTDQWFVKMERLSQTAMDAVTDGRVKIIPERYTKGYLDWLAEKRDWPVSRQLWWGHRIPIWYCKTATEADLQRAFAGRRDVVWHRDEEHGEHGPWLICAEEEDLAEDAVPGHAITREEDVLDTWFSSALWPHSTLGWPDETDELKYYYPTSTLITSRDIITLWVARVGRPAQRRRGPVPRGLHPPEDTRRLWRGDVEIERQRGRSDRRDGEVRRGLATVRAGVSDHGNAGYPHPGRLRVSPLREAHRADQGEPRLAADQVQTLWRRVLDPMGRKTPGHGVAAWGRGQRPVRNGPELLQQALERLAVRADESRGLHARRRGRRSVARRGPLGPQPALDRRAAGDRRVGRISLRRRRPGALCVCVGRVLQLLRRDGQGASSRRIDQSVGPAGVGPHARHALAAAAPDDPVRDRGGVAVVGRCGPEARHRHPGSGGREHHDRPVAQE